MNVLMTPRIYGGTVSRSEMIFESIDIYHLVSHFKVAVSAEGMSIVSIPCLTTGVTCRQQQDLREHLHPSVSTTVGKRFVTVPEATL